MLPQYIHIMSDDNSNNLKEEKQYDGSLMEKNKTEKNGEGKMEKKSKITTAC